MDFFFIFDFKSLFKYLMKQKVIRKPPSLLLVLLSKSSKSLDHMLWKEYTVYSEWHLTAFLTTGIDPSHSFRMTINISCIVTLSPSIVILNSGKNAVWESREAAMWHGVKNLLPGWHLPRILPDTFILLPFKFMHVKRTHISASPFPLSAASYPPGPLPAKYFRRLWA